MDFVTIKHGTRFTSSTKQVLRGGGPSTDDFSTASVYGSGSYGVTVCSKEMVRKFPSVTVVDSCTSDKSGLLEWQLKMINQLGFAEFRAMSSARAAAGTRFHKKVEELLKNKMTNGIPSLDNVLAESVPETHGFLRSVYGFLESLPVSVEPMVLEGKVVHHSLFYTGRFDAVLNLSDGPCLIDWKTANEGSSVATKVGNGDGLKGMYGYPKQLAAYIGAFNSDPTFKDMPKIKRGKIVIANSNGSPAEVVDMTPQDLEEYWEKFVDDVRTFWKSIESGKDNFVCYNC